MNSPLRQLSDHSHPMPTLSSLAVLPFLAYIVLYHVPKSSVSTSIAVTSPRYVVLSYTTTYATAVLFGFLAFAHRPNLADLVVPGLLLYGKYILGLQRALLICATGMYPVHSEPAINAGSYYASSTRLMRAYLKDILSNPESRKIFYFLMLNMCYMLVQMLYGIWTNSLGLISDGTSNVPPSRLKLTVCPHSNTHGVRLHGDWRRSDRFCYGSLASQ